jgi:uncharacterized protein YuzE
VIQVSLQGESDLTYITLISGPTVFEQEEVQEEVTVERVANEHQALDVQDETVWAI